MDLFLSFEVQRLQGGCTWLGCSHYLCPPGSYGTRLSLVWSFYLFPLNDTRCVTCNKQSPLHINKVGLSQHSHRHICVYIAPWRRIFFVYIYHNVCAVGYSKLCQRACCQVLKASDTVCLLQHADIVHITVCLQPLP